MAANRSATDASAVTSAYAVAVSRTVVVEVARLSRWLDGFARRNGDPVTVTVSDQAVTITSSHGGVAELAVPGAGDLRGVDDVVAHLYRPRSFACLLLRRGGFAIAHGLTVGPTHVIDASKTESRYVQSRTAAGGWSQQRFARRRDNQTRQAVDAAERQAARVLESTDPQWLITGGDKAMLDDLLSRPRLDRLAALPRDHVEVADVRRDAVDAAVEAARAVTINVTNADDVIA